MLNNNINNNASANPNEDTIASSTMWDNATMAIDSVDLMRWGTLCRISVYFTTLARLITFLKNKEHRHFLTQHFFYLTEKKQLKLV